MNKLKIIISLLIFSLIILLCSITSNAVLIDEPDFETSIDIIWYDYNDALGQRPDSIIIPIYSETDSVNLERILYAKDCTITDLGDGIRTKWTGTIKLPKSDSKLFARDYGIYTLRIPNDQQPFNDTYDSISSSGRKEWTGGVAEGPDFQIELWPNLNQFYTFNIVFEDDNNRDNIRSLFDKFNITSNIGLIEENVPFMKNNNIYTYSRYLQTYEYDANKIPVWNNPAEYNLAFFENNTHQRPNGDIVKYNLKTEKKGPIITTYVSYAPDTLDYNIPVKINFDNNLAPKPNNLQLTLKTANATYKTVNLNQANNYSCSFSNVYLRENGSDATYTVSLDNTNDWEFTIIGNQKDGFNIDAKFIGQLPTPETSETPTEEIKVPDIYTGGTMYSVKTLLSFIITYSLVAITLITTIIKHKRK